MEPSQEYICILNYTQQFFKDLGYKLLNESSDGNGLYNFYTAHLQRNNSLSFKLMF